MTLLPFARRGRSRTDGLPCSCSRNLLWSYIGERMFFAKSLPLQSRPWGPLLGRVRERSVAGRRGL